MRAGTDQAGVVDQATLEGQAVAAKAARLVEATGCTPEQAEQTLYAHKGDYDAAYSQLEEEAQHGQEGGGCYGWTFPCNDCQQVEDDIREERRLQDEEAREEYERDRERDREKYSRPY